jgi:asparagine synthase (glutamine-hydrolysing)
MPGIAGLVTRKPRSCAEAELRQMLGVMRHESFYSMRTWIDEDLGLYVGWSARGGSFSDWDAQVNETGDVALIFSGQEYPPDDTIQELRNRGHRIGDADTSYLVHRYEEDPSFPACLNGLFHGVLVDRRRRAVSLFNDRYGLHRVYYHEAGDTVYFAAEAKAILAVKPELRRIDARGLGESIALGCVVENRTIFDGVYVLPGGSLWTFANAGAPQKKMYFQPAEWEDQPVLDAETFYQRIREVFSRNLPRYFKGRERIGVSLTGGLDSRMIMAWHKAPAGTLPCYTWGGTRRDCQDVLVAREVARACGQSHEVVVLGTEFISNFADHANRAIFLTDGGVDLGLAPDVFMNQRARQIAPARMTGLYGGEVLRRVRMLKASPPLPGLFRSDLSESFQEAGKTLDGVVACHPLSFGVFRQASWFHYTTLSLEETLITMRPPFLDNEFVKTVFQAPESACRTNDVSTRLIFEGNAALSRIPTDRGLGGRPAWIEKMTHAWQEFSFKAEYAYDYGMPQWLARIDHAVSPLRLERLFLGRHKPFHFRPWYRFELASYVREMLLDPRSLSRPYVERKTVERIVDAHIRGVGNYTTEIHKLLKLELLHRNFIDAPPALSGAVAVTH